MEKNLVNISPFDFLDYRAFLRAWYEEAKSSFGFSLRMFSRLAGFQSPNMYKRVMDGERNLTDGSLNKFIKGLKLDRQQRDYFRALVCFNQAKSESHKKQYYRKLVKLRQYYELKPLSIDHYEYWTHWYHPVIRELIVAADFDGSLKNIASRLVPAVDEKTVLESIRLLERLRFIRRLNDNGRLRWEQAEPLVSTGADAVSKISMQYHQNMLGIVKERLPAIAKEQRDVSALTLGIARKRLPQLKQKIQEFRREILQLVADDDKPEDVVFLGIQMIPFTEMEGEPQRG